MIPVSAAALRTDDLPEPGRGSMISPQRTRERVLKFGKFPKLEHQITDRIAGETVRIRFTADAAASERLEWADEKPIGGA